MPVLAQALFTLVRCHFMSFSFLTARHNNDVCLFVNGLFLLHGIDEDLRRLESRDVVRGDGHRLLLGDVAGGFFGAVLDDEAAEATEVNGLAGDDGILHDLGELLDNALNLYFLNSGRFGDFIDDF